MSGEKKTKQKWPWLGLSLMFFFGPPLFVAMVPFANPLSDPLIAMCPGFLVLLGFVVSVLTFARWYRLKTEGSDTKIDFRE